MDVPIREEGRRRWPWGGSRAHDETAPGSPDGADTPDALPPAEPPRRSRLWVWFRIVLVLFLLTFIWLAITAPLSKSLEPIAPPQITLLTADGKPIARNGAIVDKPVEVAKLPEHVVDAFLSIEDRGFYDHWGISLRGTARAALSNITGGSTQGGSTITQQLAKFTFLTPEQTLTRKAREALIALWLEASLSKDDILARYLSNAYFGDNVYGLRAASLHYFHRKPENLTLEQSAMLAGLLKAPSRLAPTKNYRLAEQRMRVVLAAMVENGKLKPEEAEAARAPKLDVRIRNDLPTGTYFADWALPIVRAQEELGYDHRTITTTLDSNLQEAARRAIAGARLGKAEVALVAMRPNGEVVAMVGGRDYAKSPFNRATQARRQPGSTFKLFVYLAALEAGWKPDSIIANTEIERGSYRPRNAGGRYSEEITLEDAFARSSNVAAVRLYNQVGDEAVIEMARKLGISAPLTKGDPSVALGTASVTLVELTAAYAGVAGNRFPVTPGVFPVEEPGWLESLFDGKDSLSGSSHAAMEKMLRRAVNGGTGRAAMLPWPNFGKTGTSQDYRDALFVGYARGLVVGVWVGNDDNTPLRGVTGGSIPARIWNSFMLQAHGKRAAPARPQPKAEASPVEPLDLPDMPDLGDIPLGDARVQLREGGATISTEIGGVPLDVEVGENGVRVDGDALAERLRREAEARVREAQRPPPR